MIFMRKQINICIACAALFKVVIFIVLVIVGIYGNKNIDKIAMNIGGPSKDWDNDLISRFLSTDSQVDLEGYEYVSAWPGSWPGTIAGCYCTETHSRSRVYKGVNKYSCNYNQTYYGCIEVPEIRSVPLSNWTKDTQMLIVVRLANSSYLDLKSLRNDDGSCKEASKKCSDFCVPSVWKECPVTSIKIQGIDEKPPNIHFYNHSVAIAGQYKVYWTNNGMYRTITDLTVAERNVSQGANTWCSSPGRQQYTLLDRASDSCYIDPRYEALQVVGEQWLLDTNKVPYQPLPDFDTNDQYKWYRFAGRSLDTKPECIDSQLELALTVPDRLIRLKNIDANFNTTIWFILGMCILYIIIMSTTQLCSIREFDKLFMCFAGVTTIIELVLFMIMLINYLIQQSFATQIYLERFKQCFDDEYMQPYEIFKQQAFYRVAASYFMQLFSIMLTVTAMQLNEVDCYDDDDDGVPADDDGVEMRLLPLMQ